ncbi:MAG TPA: aminotransferase class I/II-fold pyridoxal phosphate-dependent enzyme [Anaerolineales bacterium]|nr:aminotransferase class I/II-fold pyridoxal phosphate-dependent enzyme [Anaerolineales bacterium]
MTSLPYSRRAAGIASAAAPIFRFATQSPLMGQRSKPGVADFLFGDPHEMPVPGYAEALAKWSAPQSKDWFAYKMSEPSAQTIVANTLRETRGLPFEPEDIYLTNGAFAALAVSLSAVVDPADEVIFISPPWFFYEALIVSHNATPVRVKCPPPKFDLDLDAIREAITPHTRAIIVNSPNNPTGRVYPPDTWQALAKILNEASQRNGRAIYLLSDEAYSRIVYDGRSYHSPAAHYANTFLLYTYGKTLLTPGQRIGFIALPPTMLHRKEMQNAILAAQLATGYAFPNALLQHALPDLEKLSIDIEHLQEKRDRLTGALTGMGYELGVPEGTFYLMPRSPLADDWAFTETLAQYDVLAMPGAIVELPGYFRLSLTANDEMIERSLPGFKAAIEQCA